MQLLVLVLLYIISIILDKTLKALQHCFSSTNENYLYVHNGYSTYMYIERIIYIHIYVERYIHLYIHISTCAHTYICVYICIIYMYHIYVWDRLWEFPFFQLYMFFKCLATNKTSILYPPSKEGLETKQRRKKDFEEPEISEDQSKTVSSVHDRTTSLLSS